MLICTRCNTSELDETSTNNPLSKRDNKTMICNECEQEENQIDYRILTLGTHPVRGNDWWDLWKRDANFQLLLGPDVAAKYCRLLVLNMLGEAPSEEMISEFIDMISVMDVSDVEKGGDNYGK